MLEDGEYVAKLCQELIKQSERAMGFRHAAASTQKTQEEEERCIRKDGRMRRRRRECGAVVTVKRTAVRKGGEKKGWVDEKPGQLGPNCKSAY